MGIWTRYLQPTELDQALVALASAPGSARVIAGGTDLLLDLQQGRHPPVHTLVDLSRIGELRRIELRDEGLFVGAAASLNSVIEHPLVEQHAMGLVEACRLIGGPQVRNVATLGGNVAHALPAGDGTIALLALDAEAQLAGPDGRRWLPMEALFSGPGKPSFDPGVEVLVGFRMPLRCAREGNAFQRVMRPQGVAIAILNMGIWLRLSREGIVETIRIAVGPAGPRPFRARAAERELQARAPDGQALQNAVDALRREAEFRTSPHRSTVEYRRHLASVLLERSLKAAAERALTAPGVSS